MITFLDAGVLIAAGRGGGEISDRALEIVDGSTRQLASSSFLRLEVLPKCLYYRKDKEAQFYRTIFASVMYWATDLESITLKAEHLA